MKNNANYQDSRVIVMRIYFVKSFLCHCNSSTFKDIIVSKEDS